MAVEPAPFAALPRWMPRVSFAPAHTAPRGDLLVCVFLRGAADVLNMVAPHGEAAYYALRPGLALARPDDPRTARSERLIDLDGFFGLHPALAPLLPAWQARQLAFIHACGSPDESRSHFEAMDIVERGASDKNGPASGWLGRHLAILDTGNASPLRAIGMGERIQRALYGPVTAQALRSIADFHLGGALPQQTRFIHALSQLYERDDQLAATALATQSALRLLEQLTPETYRPADGSAYPESEFGLALRQIAQLARADVGLEVACVDLGGWDTHIAQGGATGWMAGLLAELAGGLAALYNDLADQTERLTIIALSEFGRRAGENSGLGTDHGHGSMLMALGGGIDGGRIHGIWPGLEREQLVGPGDLAVTTDYRDVLGEIVQRRLNNPRLDLVFPEYVPRFLNICRTRQAE